jgi:SAM-dependent methyltransferase
VSGRRSTPAAGLGQGADPFARADPSDDAAFYALPRKVVHLEPGAAEALRAAYGALLPRDAPVLDLMASWRSHLPPALAGRVTGLGMNAEEMADNPQLHDWVVHDLNANPALPFGDGAFGAVVCSVSVQYLTRPLEVFAEVRRVLQPGGVAAVAFSNRCFPTKAVAIWLSGTEADHVGLVRLYLEASGFLDVSAESPPTGDDPLWLVWGRRPG